MKRIVVTLVLTLTGFSAQAEIISVKSMKDAQFEIEDIIKTQKAADVLVAFDIDMTLTQPNHPAVFYPAIRKYVDIYKTILGQLTPEQKDLAVTLTTQILPQKLVETETPQVIKTLQQKGIKVIALTSSLAGKIKGYKDKMIIRRRDQLQRMGLDFTNSLKNFVSVTTFFNFKKYAGGYPIFYHGVLSANGEGYVSKGEALTALLRHTGPLYEDKVRKPGFYPKVVVMIDDKKKHLEDVEECLKSYDPSIQFIGIEYEGAYTYAPQDISKEDFQKFWENLANLARAK